MTLQEILRGKGNVVYTIGPQATVRDVAERLVELRIGALLICSSSEPCVRPNRSWHRQRARRVGRAQRFPARRLRVTDVMTTQVVTGKPDIRWRV